MKNELGSLIASIALKSGLFGKKPTALDVYTNGIILKFKNEDMEYLFEHISSIKTFNYFAPNPAEYNFDVFNNSGEKISALSIPYAHRAIGTALLEAHMRFQLKNDFPQNLANSEFILDNHLSWQRGRLIHSGRKGTREYLPQQIDRFIVKDGMHFFTLKDNNDTLALLLHDSPNCLTTIEVCRAITDMKL